MVGFEPYNYSAGEQVFTNYKLITIRENDWESRLGQGWYILD
jgi:hypothetical protein